MPMAASFRSALAGVNIKITDVRIVPLRVIKEVGSLVDFAGGTRSYRLGGGSFVEVHTDQGLIGIGPPVTEADLPRLKTLVVGQDPFNIEVLATRLIATNLRGGPSVEIALWDLIGKAANQPLYKLWGGVQNRVIPYASQLRLSTIEERVAQTVRLKAEGWKAIKLRNRFPTLKEDIRLVEQVRKAVGDDFIITTDANQANSSGNNFLQNGTRWDFERAVACARAYQEMGVYWLEEPLPRYDFDHIAELNKLVELKIAGGEANHSLHEFRWLLERNAYDIIQPEIMTEGPNLMRKYAVLAESMNKLCIPHVGNQLGNICSMHLVASWSNAPYFEIFNDPPSSEMQYTNGIYENPPVFKDGYLTMPDGPGLGVTIRKDYIAK
ncbi:MAG: mandelate racemase/muconate lactonizing enzyme family protein [Steroidobacteraceae bacterium]